MLFLVVYIDKLFWSSMPNFEKFMQVSKIFYEAGYAQFCHRNCSLTVRFH